MQNRQRRNTIRRAANIGSRMANLPPRPPPPPSYRGDDPITGDEDIELFKIHEHPPEADISRAGLEAYLNSKKLNYLNKNAIICYHRPRPSEPDSHLNCNELITAPLIRSIVRDQFYVDFMDPKYTQVDPRLSTLLDTINEMIIPDKKVFNRLGFGRIYECGLCPFCLQITCREEGCAYIKHHPNGMTDHPRCDPRLQNRELFIQYRREASRLIKELHGNEFPEDKIQLQFCVECGRPCVNHIHFSLPIRGKRFKLLRQSQAGICTGGGRAELFMRIMSIRNSCRTGDHQDAVKERRNAIVAADLAAGNSELYKLGIAALLRAEEGGRGEAVWGDQPLGVINYKSDKLDEVINAPYNLNVNGPDNVDNNANDDEMSEFTIKLMGLLEEDNSETIENAKRIVDKLLKKYPIEKLSVLYESANRRMPLVEDVELPDLITNDINARVNQSRVNNYLTMSPQEYDPVRADMVLNKELLDGNTPDILEIKIAELRKQDGLPVDQEWSIDGTRRPYQMLWYRIKYIKAHPQDFERIMNDRQPVGELLGKVYDALQSVDQHMFSLNAESILIPIVGPFSSLGSIYINFLLEMIFSINRHGILENVNPIRLQNRIKTYMRIIDMHKSDELWNSETITDKSNITQILLHNLFHGKNMDTMVPWMRNHGISDRKLKLAVQKINALVLHRDLDFLMEPLATIKRILGMRAGGSYRTNQTRKKSHRNHRR